MKKSLNCLFKISFGSLLIMFLSSNVISDFLVDSVDLMTWWELLLVGFGFYLIYTSTIQLVTYVQSMEEYV